MIIGANPRKEAPVLNARIRKRWRASNLKIGVIGEKADLTYDYAYLGAGPETLATFVNHAQAKLERQIWLIGQGALARPDGAAILAMAAKAAVSVGAIKDGWNGFSVLHTAASRVGALDIGFVPGQGGKSATEMAKAGALDVVFLLGADEIDIARGAFIGLHRHAWRQRRASRRCHPAGRGLHGKIRPLREHRRPRADGGARRVSAGRCARGLGDSARSLRRARAKASLRLARRPACRAVQGASRILRASIRSRRATAADIEKLASVAARRRQGAVPLAHFRLLSHQSDRARLRHHGASARRSRAATAR